MAETPRVVVAEDDGDVRRLVERTLDDGFAVECFGDGADCWERLQTDPVPDVLLLDVTLPGLDGLELYDRVQGADRFDGVAVVFLTGRNESDVASEVGGDHEFVSKPFSPGELLERLGTIVD